MDNVIRVLLVDDRPQVRQALRSALELEEDLVVVGEASDGWEAVALAAARSPAVVVMDLGLPRLDGFSATEIIVRRALAKVVVLSIRRDDAARRRAALAGASAYVEKGEQLARLAQVIRQVAAGG